MSASLVGSEMCIRDRQEPVGACWGLLEPAGACRHLQEPAGACWSLQEPVSYTHLTLPTICSV
eukprot:2232639-Alexandrium_andersonii.AAC.1